MPLQKAMEVAGSSGGGAELSGINISTLRSHTAGVEKRVRAEILGNVKDRVFGKGGSVRNAKAAVHIANRKMHKGVARKVGRAVNKGGEVGVDLATSIVPHLSPIQVALAFRQMKEAAQLFHNDPSRQKEARVKVLLGLAEVGAFVYGVSSLTNPIGLIVAATLTTGIKIANFISNLSIKGRATEDKDRLKKLVSTFAERRFVKPFVNTLLRFVYSMDHGVAISKEGLKSRFASAASKQEKALGMKQLGEFHELYSHYYPEAQTEKRETMSKFLADKNDSWNLHTLEKDSKVIGGFTCFHLNDSKYGKQLYVEQLIPPFHKDALMNTATWEYIRKLAKDSGANRIWLEIPASEQLPADFKELDIFYAQPSLTNKNTAPVGLNEAGENPINVLRMSVLTIDPTAQGPTHMEFHKMIVQGCIADWADKNDPAWIKLNKNPKDYHVIPTREQAT